MNNERITDDPAPEADLEAVSLIEKYLASDEYFLSEQFQLSEFDWKRLGERFSDGETTSDFADCTFLYIGKRRLGKSVACQNILAVLWTSGIIEGAVIMSFTERFNYTYSDHVLRKYIFDGWEPVVVSQLMDAAREQLFMNKYGGEPAPKKVAVILDDLISEEKFFFARELSMLFAQGRHMYCNVHLITQYPLAVPPRVRVNTDFAFIFRPMATAEYEKIWRDFGETLTRPAFYCILRDYTQDDMCLVYDGRFKKKKEAGKDGSKKPDVKLGAKRARERVEKPVRQEKPRTPEKPGDKRSTGDRDAKRRKLSQGGSASYGKKNGTKTGNDKMYNPFDFFYWAKFEYPVPPFVIGPMEEWKQQAREIKDEVERKRHWGGGTGLLEKGANEMVSTFLDTFDVKFDEHFLSR